MFSVLEPRSASFSSECTPTRPRMRSHGCLLADEGQDLLEALAVEERDGQLRPSLGGELPAISRCDW